MNKYKKYWFYLTLAFIISFTILVINNINDHLIPQVIQDINSGVIGAILTTIITLLLLSNQTESQEKITKNSVVYEEKLKIFKIFLETILQCMEDGKLSIAKTKKLIYSFSILRIHISTDSAIKLEKSIQSIDRSFFYCDENSIPDLFKLSKLYNEVANVLRQELYGDYLGEELAVFDCNNLSKAHYRIRKYTISLSTFDNFINEINKYSKVYHSSKNTGLTITYKLTQTTMESLSIFHIFMTGVVHRLETEMDLFKSIRLGDNPVDKNLITYSFELKSFMINDDKYCGLPLVKLFFNDVYFAYYGLSEMNKLSIYSMWPVQKLLATEEIFDINLIEKHNVTIFEKLRKVLISIEPTLFVNT